MQEDLGDRLGAGRSAEQLAELCNSGSERTAFLKAAAEHYLAADRRERAREVAQLAFDSDPHDVTAASIPLGARH